MLEQIDWSLGRFGDCRLDKGGGAARMHGRGQGCLPAAAGKRRPRPQVRFSRSLGNAEGDDRARASQVGSEGTTARGRRLRPCIRRSRKTSRNQLRQLRRKRRRGLGENRQGQRSRCFVAPDAGGRRRESASAWVRRAAKHGPGNGRRTVPHDPPGFVWTRNSSAGPPRRWRPNRCWPAAAMGTALGRPREAQHPSPSTPSAAKQALPCDRPQHARP